MKEGRREKLKSPDNNYKPSSQRMKHDGYGLCVVRQTTVFT
jgi:hypothetical protein